MNEHLTFFTTEQGNFFVRVLLAHILSDFVLQTDKMVSNKKWTSSYMFYHIAIVFVSTFIFTASLKTTIAVTILHWLIDGLKIKLTANNRLPSLNLFLLDQLLHIITIIVVWAFYFSIFPSILSAAISPFTHYESSLIILGYIIVIYPFNYLIKFTMKKLLFYNNVSSAEAELNVEHGGKVIGQFERIIILTFVLLNQYEAIGFLITGKSIIRFADHNSNLKSEYVLVGTMMSYALSILTGVIINHIISLA
jgi:hypothetical protein